MSFVTSYGWRIHGSTFRSSNSQKGLLVCKLLQPETYAVGVDEFILGCIFGYLCPFVFHGDMDRLENRITPRLERRLDKLLNTTLCPVHKSWELIAIKKTASCKACTLIKKLTFKIRNSFCQTLIHTITMCLL